MVTAKKSAIIYMVLLSLALLVPSLMIFTTDHQARSDWERRKLDTLPTVSEMADNPKAGFKKFDGWMNDHVGFGFQAIRFRRRAFFQGLGVTGDNYIVGNGDGAFYLTAPFMQEDRSNAFQWWKHNCQSLVSDKTVDRYRRTVITSQKTLGRFGAKVIYTAVPTKSVLTADRLPKSAPKDVAEACGKIDAQNNGMMKTAALLPEQNFYYPYDLFKARTAQDPLFFPDAAYHWAGESTWTFIEDFAARENLALSRTWPEGPCVPHKVRWDIGTLIGVSNVVDGCNRDVRELRLNKYEKYAYPLDESSDIDSVKLFALTNPYAANDKNAVLISNSFGPLVREQFASLFKTTYHMNLNALNKRDLKLLLHESDILDTDYIVVIVADFHYPNFLGPIK